MMLSGTPIKNNIGEFWNLLRLCNKNGRVFGFERFNRKNQFFKFQYYFSNPIVQYFGNREVINFEGVKNTEELKKVVNSCRIRMKAKDTIDLPDTQEIDIVVKEKHKFDKDFKELLEKDLGDKNETYMLVKKINAIAKCDHTVKHALETIENGEKVVIFTDHVISADKIAGALGVKAISGKTSIDERARRVSEFEQSRTPLALVATIGALSVGVNLTSASYMIFNDLPFVPADLDQAKKRIHRIGQTKKCFYYYVYISEMDRKLQKMIYTKREVIEKF